MWELMLEIDYNTLRSAMWAGYMLTFLLPFAAVYIINKKDSVSFKKYDYLLRTQQWKQANLVSFQFNRLGLQRFFTYVRRKESPDDSDGPSFPSLLK
ncbi:hypothetical protein ACN6MY_08820 [Peribacillus sp. B-H-3]|jgi:hypothetical protein|uniref:hypothetical protein n=1 Tax=Bacillaceae TaxID=186817 RepID=UPI0008EAEEFA|nr:MULTISPECIES: hypothetical protein [unclassified Bacillus (in: firmicutes)]OIK14525.1 hypothetical protein BIV59_03045 [Bacillus sp. MUM 13]SFC01825.1 hypothetical protein SAMN05443252_101472 [Bacillus sp. OV322]